MRKGACTATTITNFLIVKALSSYCAILGCASLNSLKAITSTHQAEAGVGEVRGEQALVRECYIQKLKLEGSDVHTVKD